MAQTLSAERISREKWDALAPTFRDASYRQCSSYASAAARHVGATSELMRLSDNQDLIGLADVRVKQIPMTPLGIAYSNYAPIVMRDEHAYEQQFGRCLDALRDEYVERRHLVLRITPALNGGLFSAYPDFLSRGSRLPPKSTAAGTRDIRARSHAFHG